MNTYFFLFGNTPALSLAELEAVLSQTQVTLVQPTIAQADLLNDAAAQATLAKLGGTVKVIRIAAEINQPSETELCNHSISVLLKNTADEKIRFALAELGRDHLPRLDARILKERLQQLGKTVQYKDGSRHGLSAAILLHKKKVQEIYIIGTKEGTYVGKTIAVQDIDDWTNRDRNKPYADSKKGMLPPKVARMMVNLALAHTTTDAPTVLDPFCGSGTVLLEALQLGCAVIGSDQDETAVAGTKANIAWFQENYHVTNTATVLQADATKVRPPVPIQAIVTEPFLGKPRPNPSKLPAIFKGLEKLYKGSLKHWTNFLIEGAVVVMIFPKVTSQSQSGKKLVYSFDAFIDSLVEIGYTTVSEPIVYSRPQAIVEREIYTLVYKKTIK